MVWLGIDIGTTSVKISAVDNDGTELISNTRNTFADIESNIGERGFEQCPLEILKVIENVVQPVLSAYQARIKGIGVTGQMHGVVLWRKIRNRNVSDKDEQKMKESCLLDEAVCHTPSHLYTWQDQRCSPSFLGTIPLPSNRRLPISTGHGCATLFWLARNETAVLENGQFSFCGTIMDFFIWLLCGLDHPVTSDQLAASLGYFDPNTMGWDSALLDSTEFPTLFLPSVVPAGTKVGVVRPLMSSWPSGIPVLVGMGDVQCAMGSLLTSSQQAAVNIGTSVQLGFLVSNKEMSELELKSPPSISFFPYFDQRHLALCAGLNGGNAIQHFVECVANWMRQLGLNEDACSTSSVFSKLHQMAREDDSSRNKDVSCKSTLKIRPTFQGERHDPDMCGEINNISLINFQNIGHIFLSVCEGVVNHLGTMVPPSYLCERGIDELFVCGSVPDKNEFVKAALHCVYGGANLSVKDSNSSSSQASSAFGAAIIANGRLKI